MTNIKPDLDLQVTKANDSSARFTLNGTSVIVGIHGPIESRNQQNVGMSVDVSVRIPSGIPGASERSLEEATRVIIQECTDFRCLTPVELCVSIEVVCNNGSLISVVANAVMLALLDSGIPLRTIAVASSYHQSVEDVSHLVQNIMTDLVVCTKTGKVLYARSAGTSDDSQFDSAIVQMATRDGAKQRDTILQRFKELIEKKSASW
jgi:ribonuclease PH